MFGCDDDEEEEDFLKNFAIPLEWEFFNEPGVPGVTDPSGVFCLIWLVKLEFEFEFLFDMELVLMCKELTGVLEAL